MHLSFGVSEQATDSTNEGLDEGVARADLTVKTFYLEQFPLQRLPKPCSHVSFQLQTQKEQNNAGKKSQIYAFNNIFLPGPGLVG